MRFLILGRSDTWYTRDLQRAAGTDHHVVSCSFERLAASVGPHGTRIIAELGALENWDGVLVRSMPLGSLEQVVFRMDVLGGLEQAGCTVLNPPRALEAAIDKYLALDRLARAGLHVPRTFVCQSWRDAMDAFAQLDSDAVLKPLFGSEGRGLTRLTDEAIAFRAFKMLEQAGAVIYLQQYIEHPGYDIRLFVVGRQVLGMRRRNAEDWRTNVSRGAVAEPITVTASLAETAQRASQALGATLAGVDLLPARDGTSYVIEVNAVPGWKALARTLHTDVARLVLEHLAQHGGEERP